MAPSLKRQPAKVPAQVSVTATSSQTPGVEHPSTPQEGGPSDTTSNEELIKVCPTCGHTSTKLADMRSHFTTCVELNGTPTGGRCDDSIFVPRPDTVKRKRDDMDEM